jgi:hypothetical protein
MWETAFHNEQPELGIDHSVLDPEHFIYTARPTFKDCTDPVPPECRVAIIDGPAQRIPVSWMGLQPLQPKPEPKPKIVVPVSPAVDENMSDWMVEISEADAGMGVAPLWLNPKAAIAIKRIYTALDGCPPAKDQISPKGDGRHFTLNAAAYWLMKLVAEGELSEKEASKFYFDAASQIKMDDKYDADSIQAHWDYVWRQS